MSCFIVISTVYFLVSFRDFNDGVLIGKKSSVVDEDELDQRRQAEESEAGDMVTHADESPYITQKELKFDAEKGKGSTNSDPEADTNDCDDSIVGENPNK